MSGTNKNNADLLRLQFQNIAWANIGDTGGLRPSVVAGSLFISLHSADPGEAGNQSTNEISAAEYGQYARQAVARSNVEWTVTEADPANVQNANIIAWATMTTGTGQTATHFGIGVAVSGATDLLYSGALTSSLAIGVGVSPEAAAGAINTNAD